jgi:beta-lactamase class A
MKKIFLGIIICVALEFMLYSLNHKYRFWTPIFSYTGVTIAEEREWNGTLTNPLLECNNLDNNDHIDELNISKFRLTNFVEKIKDEGKAQLVSVYIRDLNNGPWIGINEKEEFIGGSLLKVPLLMSYLKKSEYDKDFLSQNIEYKDEIVEGDVYFSTKKIETGETYTVLDLLQNMIKHSDNNAAQLLFAKIGNVDFLKTFESLGMGDPNPNVPYPTNTKTYAGFFRVMFNSSYLSRENSEFALKMLVDTDFDKGIKAFLPRDLVVAHKYGIRTDNEIFQLHDCGIVYYPKHPYLLCIMTRGKNLDSLVQSIANISKFVYDDVTKSLKKD